MSHRLTQARTALILALLACLTCTSCHRSTDVTFIPEGDSYTAKQVRQLASETDVTGYADIKRADIGEERQQALATLRSYGEDGSEIASLLTRLFPSDTAAIPVWVESGRVDNVDAWIVIEVWAPRDGTLVNTRVWVFDRATETILLAASFS